MHYDLSQLETYVAMSGEGILAASLGADTAEGDDGDERVLRCAGDDEWIAVGLPDEATVTRLAAPATRAPPAAAMMGGRSSVRSPPAGRRRTWRVSSRSSAWPPSRVVNAAELAADAHLRAGAWLPHRRATR